MANKKGVIMILHHLTELRGLNCLPARHNRKKSHPWIIETCILWAFSSELWKRVVSVASVRGSLLSSLSCVHCCCRSLSTVISDGFFIITGMPSPQRRLVVSWPVCPSWALRWCRFPWAYWSRLLGTKSCFTFSELQANSPFEQGHVNQKDIIPCINVL